MLFNLIWSDDYDIGNLVPFVDANIINYSSNVMSKMRSIKIYMLHPLLFMCVRVTEDGEILLGYVSIGISGNMALHPQFNRAYKSRRPNNVDMDYIFSEMENFLYRYACIYHIPVQLANTLSIHSKITLNDQIFISKILMRLQDENINILISNVKICTGETLNLLVDNINSKQSREVVINVDFTNNAQYVINITNDDAVVERIGQRLFLFSGNMNEFGE